MSEPNETAEPSGASRGSVDEPAAWGVLRVGGGWVSILANEVQAETSRKSWDAHENWVHEVVPLYAKHPRAVRLPKLLEKMHGETEYGKGYNTALRMCQEILEAAGVEMSESES